MSQEPGLSSLDPVLLGWIEAYCHGTIDAVGFAQLEQRLQQDAVARAWFRQYLGLDAALRDHGEAPGAAWAADPEMRVAKRKRGLNRFVLIGTAAAVAAAVLVAVAVYRGRDVDRIARVPAPEEAMDDGVALLTRTVDVVWAMANAPRAGAVLPPGVLRFKAGIVQLEFYSGARVVLEGPAEFELVSIHRGVCRQGKLRATVPPQAKGFAIAAPRVELVDLGTEFGVDVGREGQTDVHVFAGKVEWSDHRAGPRQELAAGHGLRFPAAGDASRIAARPETFVSFEELERRSTAETQQRYQTWRRASDALRRDARLLVYYAFEYEAPTGRTLRSQDEQSRSRDGAIVGCTRVEGRWPDKAALEYKRPGDRVRLQVEATRPSLTFAAWVRVDGLDHRFNALLLTDRFAPGEPHWQIDGQGQLILGLNNGTQKYDYASAPIFGPATFGQWTHLATVYDHVARTVTHYVNGQAVHREPLRFDIDLHIGMAELGNWGAPRQGEHHPVRNLNGRIDEFALFGAALGAEEIRAIYEVGKPRS